MGALHLSGRQAELGVIATILRDVRRRGTALVLAGPAGIGKSSLLEHASQVAARAGHRVLRTVGVESEQRMSFAGLAQLLRPVVSQTSTLPALQKKALRGAMGLDEGPAPEVFLVGLAALNLLSDVASEQPVVVLVDDAQWLDAQSLAVLAFLARRVAEDAVALVVAMRDGHPSSSTLTGLRQMQVLPLNEQSAREILRDVAGDLSAADQERILAQSLGNPLALVELPAAWRSAGSAAAQFLPHLLPLTNQLERAFAGRLPELPELTRTALLVGAVDTEGELDEILAATRMMVRTAVDVDVLEPAARVGLITYDHAHLHFRHPLVKSGILQAESTVRRQAANAALADVLQHQPLRRVWYRAQSIIGTNDAVADELEASSTELARRGSSTPAVTALERAAQLTRDPAQRGRRLLLAAELAVGVGQSELVTRLLNAAASHSLTDLDHARLEWIREIPGESDFGDAQRVLRLVHIAERAFLAPDVDLGLNLLVTAALRCWWANADPIVGARVVAMAEEHTLATDDPRYIAVIAMAQPLHGGRVVDRLLATVSPEHVADPEALLLFGMAAFAIGDQPRAAEFLDRAESRCRLQGRLGVLTRVLALQSPVRIDLGDWKGAVAAVDEGRRLAVDTGQPVWGSGTMASDARVHALLGDAQQARELAAAVEASAGPRRNACLLSIVQLSRGFALMNAGRHLDAFEALRRAFTVGDPSCHAREALS
ncbi:MAG TPA: ATP-binding protein, partial [Propionibacteriaceae bacterium]